MINKKDFPYLETMLTMLKDINYKYGIQYDSLYYIAKDKFPERLKDNRLLIIEFKRLSEFFIKTDLSEFVENNRFGLTLVPKNEILEINNIRTVYKKYKKNIKHEKTKDTSEIRQRILTGWKFYTFWIIVIISVLSLFYKTFEFIEYHSNVENMQKKVINKE